MNILTTSSSSNSTSSEKPLMSGMADTLVPSADMPVTRAVRFCRSPLTMRICAAGRGRDSETEMQVWEMSGRWDACRYPP